jgi:uncharacterized membrane protein required for colicin V production
MTLRVAVDAVVLIVVVIATWSGSRRGAARMIVSTLATIAGIFIAAEGRGPVSEVASRLLPSVDARLISLLILVGAAWIFLSITSWVLGHVLRALLQALHLGPIDTLTGALLGLIQGLSLCTALLFLFEATRALDLAVPEPLTVVINAVIASQAAEVMRGVVYTVALALIGSSLPTELQQILQP